MSIFAIGDVQGCYDALRRLLDKVAFEAGRDTLWFAGDLVNRGPDSLEVLRYVRSLPNVVAVLGNHDLHLLAVASGLAPAKKRDTFESILAADDRDDLLGWLRSRPLIHVDPQRSTALLHAGLLPQWTIEKAVALAREAEDYIARSDHNDLFRHMYGDTPHSWDDGLGGWARVRIVINAFTRLRYCDLSGGLDLRPKMAPGQQPTGLVPWFEHPDRLNRNHRLIFGHWSTLGFWDRDGVVCLDSGCLWGGSLSAVRIGDEFERLSVPCDRWMDPK